MFAPDHRLYRALERLNIQPVLVTPGQVFRRLNQRVFQVDPAREDDYRQLLQLLAQQDMMPGAVIHAWSHESFPRDREALERQLNHGLYSMFFLCKALLQPGLRETVRLVYLYPDNGGVQPVYEAVGGLACCVGWENPRLIVQTAALELPADPGDEPALTRIANLALRQLLEADEPGRVLRYEGDQPLVKRFRELDPGIHQPFHLEDLLKEKGVYIVTGGAGGLGLLFVQYLAQKVKGVFVLG